MAFLQDMIEIVEAYNTASDDQTKKEKLEAFTAKLKQEMPSFLTPDLFNQFIAMLSVHDTTGECLQQVIECFPEQPLTLAHLEITLQSRGKLGFIQKLIVKLIKTEHTQAISQPDINTSSSNTTPVIATQNNTLSSLENNTARIMYISLIIGTLGFLSGILGLTWGASDEDSNPLDSGYEATALILGLAICLSALTYITANTQLHKLSLASFGSIFTVALSMLALGVTSFAEPDIGETIWVDHLGCDEAGYTDLTAAVSSSVIGGGGVVGLGLYSLYKWNDAKPKPEDSHNTPPVVVEDIIATFDSCKVEDIIATVENCKYEVNTLVDYCNRLKFAKEMQEMIIIVKDYNANEKSDSPQTKTEKIKTFTLKLEQEVVSLSNPVRFNELIAALWIHDTTGEFLQKVIEYFPEQPLTLLHLEKVLQLKGSLDFIQELIIRLIKTNEIERIIQTVKSCKYEVKPLVDYCNQLKFEEEMIAIVKDYNKNEKSDSPETKIKKIEAFTLKLEQEVASLSNPVRVDQLIAALSAYDTTGEFLRKIIECLNPTISIDHLESALRLKISNLGFIQELIIRLIECADNDGYHIIETVIKIATNHEHLVGNIIDYCDKLKREKQAYEELKNEMFYHIIDAHEALKNAICPHITEEDERLCTQNLLDSNLTSIQSIVRQAFSNYEIRDRCLRRNPNLNISGAPLTMAFWILEKVLKTKELGNKKSLQALDEVLKADELGETPKEALETHKINDEADHLKKLNRKENFDQLFLGSLILALKLTYGYDQDEHGDYTMEEYGKFFGIDKYSSIKDPESFLTNAECRVIDALQGDLLPEDWEESVLKYERALMPLHGHAATSRVQFTQPAAQTPTLNNSRSAPAAPQ